MLTMRAGDGADAPDAYRPPLPEFTLTTPTAPGVTHRWTRLEDFTEAGRADDKVAGSRG